MEGSVTDDGVPLITLSIAGRQWPAVIDTGFNGDLELPESLKEAVNARFLCRIRSLLAGGQLLEEDNFLVDFPFDGSLVTAEATFTSGDELLIGTAMLGAYCLEVDFPRRMVRLTRDSFRRAN